MTGMWRTGLWEDFFNQSAVGMFRPKVNTGEKCTKVRGQDKYKIKRKHLKFSSIMKVY